VSARRSLPLALIAWLAAAVAAFAQSAATERAIVTGDVWLSSDVQPYARAGMNRIPPGDPLLPTGDVWLFPQAPSPGTDWAAASAGANDPAHTATADR
jgi:hypothetical protein